MKNLYLIVRNTLIFFFIAVLAGSALGLSTAFAEKLFIGLMFGVLITLIPHILRFFKLPVNNSSFFLLSIILCFIFFVLMSYVFALIRISGQLPDLFTFLGIRSTADTLMNLIYLTLIASFVTLGIEVLDKNR